MATFSYVGIRSLGRKPQMQPRPRWERKMPKGYIEVMREFTAWSGYFLDRVYNLALVSVYIAHPFPLATLLFYFYFYLSYRRILASFLP